MSSLPPGIRSSNDEESPNIAQNVVQDAQAEQQEIPGIRPAEDIPDEPEEPESRGIIGSFQKGVNESVSGQLSKLFDSSVDKSVPKKAQKQVKNPSFWENLAEGAGTLLGDAPYIAAGGTLGAIVGSALGSEVPVVGTAIGGVAGAGAGGLAFPTFLKESLRQYHDFQDQGNDLTFGEFLERANDVADSTLREGAMGIVLGSVQKSLPVLKEIPGLGTLFSTKYVGKPIQKATELGIEAVTATAIPSISQFRIPTLEDAAQASILFLGQRIAHIPQQIPEVIRQYKSRGINNALANDIRQANLAYPPIQELQGKERPVYKNSLDLDRNLAAFDESYIKAITDQINNISPTDIESTHNAGSLLQQTLIGYTPDSPIQGPSEGPTQARPVRLINNPLAQAVRIISPEPFRSEVSGGEEIFDAYHENRAADKSPLDLRYDIMKEQAREINFIETNVHEEIDNFTQEFAGSDVPGSSQERIVNVANRISERFVTRDPDGNVTGYQNVNLADLMASIRDINSIPTYDVQPTMASNLLDLVGILNRVVVEQGGAVDPEFANEYTNLTGDYAEFKQRYDNDKTQVFHKRTERGKSIFNQALNIDTFNTWSQALETSPRGQEVMNRIRREAWQKELGPEALQAVSEADFDGALERTTDRTYQNLMDWVSPMQQGQIMGQIEQTNQLRQASRAAEEGATAQERNREMRNLENQEAQRMAKEVQTKQGLLTSILTNDPANLIQNVQTVEGIKRTWNSLENVPEGRQTRDALARFETENMMGFLGEGYTRTGRVPYKDLKIQLSQKDFRAKLEALNGKRFVDDLDHLVNITEKLSPAFLQKTIKYASDPVTYQSNLNIMTGLGIATGHLHASVALRAGAKGVEKASNFWNNKRNYTPEAIHKAVKAAEAIQSGNQKDIRNQAMKFSPIKSKKK